MDKTNKKPYAPPCVVETLAVYLERSLLFGSIVDQVPFVETAGQENGGFYESEFTDGATSTFNHTWGGEN